MANRPTKKQVDNAEKILISWKKKMPFYYAAAIIIAFIIILFSSNSNKELSMHQKNINDFTPPTECTFKLSGKNVYEKMVRMLEKLYNEKIILDHGMEVGKELARVLSGGDTTLENTLSEDDLYKLELDAFMKLIETEKTQDRIKHTLKTGKPLVN